MKITIELTTDEAAMIAYALKELGHKRSEDAIDRNSADCRKAAVQHYRLSERIYAETKRDDL